MHGAVVCKLTNFNPIPGADKIQTARALGYTIIVGKDIDPEILGLFFDSELQLSPEFAGANDLIRRKDAEGKDAGGYFEGNRRVRVIRMKGTKSEGFWCPLSTLNFTNSDTSKLKSGEVIAEFGGIPICNKYITPSTRRRRSGTPGVKVVKINRTPTFVQHVETEQLKRCLSELVKGDIITITEKLHGTSHRIGKVLEEGVPKGGGKLITWVRNKLGIPISTPEQWVILNGTRRTTIQQLRDGYYGDAGFRLRHTQVEPYKGEIIFGEVVGYTDTTPIMGPQDTTKLKDKKILKDYGPSMVFSYGCEPGASDFYVYRIARVNEDKVITDLSHPALVSRCGELGLKVVPHFETFIYDGNEEALLQRVIKWVEDDSAGPLPSTIDARHIREGVVVRKDGYKTDFYKVKATVFGILEGYLKEQDTFIDIEESESLELETSQISEDSNE